MNYFIYLIIFILLNFLNYSNSQFLKIDQYDDLTSCKGGDGSFSTEWIRLGYCNGQHVYKYNEDTTTITNNNNNGTISIVSNKNVVLYYCFGIECKGDCITVKTFPIGVCTSSNNIDSVKYSISNEINVAHKIDNDTDSNGYCQMNTYSTSTCLSGIKNQVFQYNNNNHCGKGIKINCTSTLYNEYSCIDSKCNQCSLVSSHPLDRCMVFNNYLNGVYFKSILKSPISNLPFTLEPINETSSERDYYLNITFPIDDSSSSTNSDIHNTANSLLSLSINITYFIIITLLILYL